MARVISIPIPIAGLPVIIKVVVTYCNFLEIYLSTAPLWENSLSLVA